MQTLSGDGAHSLSPPVDRHERRVAAGKDDREDRAEEREDEEDAPEESEEEPALAINVSIMKLKSTQFNLGFSVF